MTPSTETGILIAIIANISLQGLQMFLDSKKTNQDDKIRQLQEDLSRALKKIDAQEVKIEDLQSRVFEITKSEAFYKGRLDALEAYDHSQIEKITAVKKFSTKTTTTLD